ncbi:MAG: pentapeptide repeat-containing protein, partial [Pseudomonadota bacterium]
PNAEHWDGTPLIDFREFHFPDGAISFNRATFGEGYVSFDFATFGEGDVRFVKANFGEGYVSFYYAIFGKGDVRFDHANFGEGYVDFRRAIFGEGNVSFNRATFGEGYVSFEKATFGEGDVWFHNTVLGKEKGDVDFSWASFGRGAVSFGNLAFAGTARFTELENVEQCTRFSFEGCSFDKLFTFSHEGRIGCPLDLRRTKLAHTLVVHDIHCDYAKTPQPDWTARLSNCLFARPLWPHPFDKQKKKHLPYSKPSWEWRKTATYREDSQRFRRLKELAASSHNHAKTLEFNAQEKRSRRGNEEMWLGEATLDLLYATLSNYGRSVLRPLIALGALWGLFSALFWWARVPFTEFTDKSFALVEGQTRSGLTAFNYAASNLLSFIPTGRTARTQGEDLLFGGIVPDWIVFVGGVQSLLSVILLFLLGLALRNMFRV